MVARALLLLAACSSSTSESGPPSYDAIAPALATVAPKTSSIVTVGGAIEFEYYAPGMQADTLHDTRSAMKSITALAIGIAIDRKLVALDTPVFPLLADLAPFAHDGPAKQAITIADFLTMSSALDCNDDVEASPGNEDHMYPLPDWARWAVDLPTKPYTRDATGRGPFSYCTAGTFLLGQVIERVAKQPVDRFIAEHLLAPMGITRFEFPKSPKGEIMTGGGLRLRARDIANIAEMIRAGGTWRGAQIVPKAFLERALHVQRRVSAEQDYGYLFWHRTYRTPCGAFEAWYMSGNGGNAVAMIPALDASVVIARTNYRTRGMHPQTTAVVETLIAPVLCAKRRPHR